MTEKQAPMAQRSLQKLYFDHKDMDYYLSWMMGRQVVEGADESECLAVAARVVDGDPQSWQQEWPVLARRLEEQAQAAHDGGEREEARKVFLRACTAYRAALMMMDPKDPHFREYAHQQRACFRQAAALFDPPIETIEIPYLGRQLAGYFWKATPGSQPRPTLLVIGGMETWAEDAYFITGQLGARRGYNLLTIDLPGQGFNPDYGLSLEPRMEFPMKAAVDYALSRPEVDPARLAVFGFSWGGYIVLKGAEHDPRIQALVANPPMPDIMRAGLAQQSGHGKSDPVGQLVFAQLAWRFGVSIGDFFGRMAKAFGYLRYGKANCARIQCPTLLIAGEDEAQITLKLARECFEKLPNPHKKLAILTREEGGEAHCQVNNLPLLNQILFDYLDGVFARRDNGEDERPL